MEHLSQKILIVDDEKANRQLLRELLQEEATIIFAKNGEQSLELAEKHLPDLILLDIMMPDMSGFEVMAKIKSNPATINISVIFITGLANSDDEEKGFDLGCCDYIYKPFKANVVVARVLTHLELIQQRKILNEIAHIDALTGVSNRREMDAILAQELLANERDNNQLAVVLIDIDYFKDFNDNYGHGAGDIALKKVAASFKEVLHRPRDFIARFGGEEFVIILPDIDLNGVKMVLNNINQSLAAKEIKHEFSQTFNLLTISLGAVLIDGKTKLTPENVLNKADQLLYKAKHQGRNQMVIEAF